MRQCRTARSAKQRRPAGAVRIHFRMRWNALGWGFSLWVGLAPSVLNGDSATVSVTFMACGWMDQLNDAQREAVTHASGPLLVIAGAGTGKTKTLAARVAHLIKQGAAPERILLLTFTRRAAAQMIQRVRQLLDSAAALAVWSGTFHSVANRLLRIYGPAVKLACDFTVMDPGGAADLMNLIRSDLGYAKAKKRFPNKTTLVKIYSHTVSAQAPLSEALARYFPWCADEAGSMAAIFEEYALRKTQQHVLDYDDLLLYWRVLLGAPGVGRTVADRFDHLLVDEYQDTNNMQGDIVRCMRQGSDNVMVVGDDAQSIYSFRAATVRNILDFPKQFDDTRVIALEKNYRSVQPILDASNAVMEEASQRYTKNLYSDRDSCQKPILLTCQDEDEQTEAVCTQILDHLEQGIALRHQAVLFRAASHSAKLEIELSRRNIPFHKYGGLRYVETAHIKDAIAVLRILENPFDQLSWFRVLQLLDGIGPKTARRLMDQLLAPPPDAHVDSVAANATSPAAPLLKFLFHAPQPPAHSREQYEALCDVLRSCSGCGAEGSADVDVTRKAPALATQIELIRRYYEPIFNRVYENAKMRLRDLEQLEQIAAGYRSRQQFITDLTLDPPTSTADFAKAPHLDEDYLILSTIHSAKGCEWDSVHIIHAADGMIPSDMAVTDQAGVDEERRLFYVAMTRAKDWLYVYFPLRYYHTKSRRGDAHTYAQLTRFVDRRVRPLFEQRHTNRPGDAKADEMGEADGVASVNDWLGKLFRS